MAFNWLLDFHTTKIVVYQASQNYEPRRILLHGFVSMARRTNIRLVFQQRLKEARLRIGLSQKDLGIEAGLDPFVASTRVNRYEVGVHEPDLSMISRLAQALDVPAAYLLAEDDRLARLILAFDSLSVAEKERLLKSLEPKVSPQKNTTRT